MDAERRNKFMELTKEQLVDIIDLKEAHNIAMQIAFGQISNSLSKFPASLNLLAEAHDKRMAEIVWPTPAKGN
jgi:hypothetical protein